MIVEKLEIPRKPNNDKALSQTSNRQPNGSIVTNGTHMKRKRSLDEPDNDETNSGKRGKLLVAFKDDDTDPVVVLEDSGNGAIVIEDD